MSPRHTTNRLIQRWRYHAFHWMVRWQAWLKDARVELNISQDAQFGRGIRVEVGRKSQTRLEIGPRCAFSDQVRFRLHGGQVTMGERVHIRAGAVLNAGGGSMHFDGFNNISWGVVIHCAESVHLSRYAHVAEYSTIVDSSHYYSAAEEWSYHNTRSKPVFLGKDVWVCPKSTITSGVTIGDHTIVGANSCVTRSAPGGVLLSGVPASIVRHLKLPWEDATAVGDHGTTAASAPLHTSGSVVDPDCSTPP